jgi:hypothetical protein
MARNPFLDRSSLSRRDFLASSAAAFLGVSALPLLAAPMWGADPAPAGSAARRPTARNIIYLYMSGGMSHLDTFDPKPGTAVQGPVQPLATSADGVQITQYLPLLSKQMHRCALVRSLNSNQGAHEQGNYLMHTSYALRGTVKHPCMGAWMLRFSGRTNKTIPGNVVIQGGSNYPGAGYLDPQYAPLLLGNPAQGLKDSVRPAGVDEARYQRRLELLQTMNQDFQAQYKTPTVAGYQDAYQQALALMKSDDLKAFDITQEPEGMKAAYGEEPFGQGCLLARRLIEHGVRYVEVDLGGWDTHSDNFDRVEEQAGILDRGLGALLPDLDSRGMLDETLVVVTSEFGRTPELSDNNGRNHHPKCFSAMLAGGGVKGGQVYGASDANADAPAKDPVTVEDFNATIAFAAGLPLDEVVHSPAGRPFTIADKGRPLTALFS